MKKYIALIALLAVTGCGSSDKDINETTTEVTSETTTESTSDTTATESEEETDEEYEETTAETVKVQHKNNESSEKSTQAPKAENFESSSAYASLQQLASNAGFDVSYSNNQVVFKTYITDDTIDYINSKDATYKDKWEENCGLYEEFSSEAMRNVENSGSNVSVVVEVIGRSDNKVYFKNENGTSIYDAYIN